MSTNPDQHRAAPCDRENPASTIEAVADKLVALIEEFEPAIREGQVPREFAQRLSQLRQAAERLTGR